MGRNDQVTRIIRVINYLESNPQGLSVKEIHLRLESQGVTCSLRSVYRDLEAIERAYLPVVREGTGDESRWRLEVATQMAPKVQFSYNELMAMFVARNELKRLKGSPVHFELESFFTKLELCLGPKAQEGLKEFKSYLGFKATPAWEGAVSKDILGTLHQACAEGHYLEIEYRSVSGDFKGELKRRRVGPESILFSESGGYLVALDPESRTIKMFAIARIQSATLLDEEYEAHGAGAEIHVSESIGVFAQGEVHEIEIELKEPMASFVAERRWHESQSVTRTSFGITLRLTARVNDELARWVLGLGPEARVLKPTVLQERLSEMSLEISEQYTKKTG